MAKAFYFVISETPFVMYLTFVLADFRAADFGSRNEAAKEESGTPVQSA